MMKKFYLMLTMFIMAVSLCAAPAVKIDRSSKEKVVETLLWTICVNDRDALWELMAPENREQIKLSVGSDDQGKQLIWNILTAVIPKDQISEMKQILTTPETRKEIVNHLTASLNQALVEKEGKWYLDFAKLAHSKDKETPVPTIKWQVDQSSKEKLVFTFLMAAADRNIDALWQILPQEIKIAGIAACGSEQKAKEDMVKHILKSASEEEVRNMKRLLANPATAEPFIRALLPKMEKGMVKIDGKWFLDISKFND